MRMKIKTLIGVDAAGGALPQAQNTADVPLSRAQWWRPSDVESSASWGDDEGDGKFRRCMMGEMTLPSSLTPSFTFGKFDLRVRYILTLLLEDSLKATSLLLVCRGYVSIRNGWIRTDQREQPTLAHRDRCPHRVCAAKSEAACISTSWVL